MKKHIIGAIIITTLLCDRVLATPPQENSKTGRAPETSLTYVRIGTTMGQGSVPGAARWFLGAIGHRRTAENFFYGGEYAYHFSDNGIRSSEYNFLMGYRPNWNYRVVPVVSVGGGLVTQSENVGGVPTKTNSGLTYFWDVGGEVYSYDFIDFSMKTNIGVRFVNTTLTMDNKNFLDFYFLIGFGW